MEYVFSPSESESVQSKQDLKNSVNDLSRCDERWRGGSGGGSSIATGAEADVDWAEVFLGPGMHASNFLCGARGGHVGGSLAPKGAHTAIQTYSSYVRFIWPA